MFHGDLQLIVFSVFHSPLFAFRWLVAAVRAPLTALCTWRSLPSRFSLLSALLLFTLHTLLSTLQTEFQG